LVKIYQTILFFPYFLSWVVVGYSAYVLLSSSYGVINSIIVKLGGENVNWYSDSKYWLPILLIAYVMMSLTRFLKKRSTRPARSTSSTGASTTKG
jgi:ABC-type polysaccharide transport system permease subunit